MTVETFLLILALVVGFYMAWNIGANDVANAVGTSVGSKALTLKQAVILAAILEFSGAFFLGSHVSSTIQKDIVYPEMFTHDPMIFVYGLLAALCASGAWLQIASYLGWPVSTTHTIVGAMLGFGLIVGGKEAVNWHQVSSIVASWVISPIMGGVLGFVIFTILRRKVFYSHYPVQAAKKIAPYLAFSALTVLSLASLLKSFSHIQHSFWIVLAISLTLGILAFFIARWLVKKVKDDGDAIKRESLGNPQVEVSLKKALKHLSRSKEASSGEMSYYVSLISSEVKNLISVSQQHQSSRASNYVVVEKIFSYFQYFSACFMAFAHGANDVANAIGPLVGVVQVLQTHSLDLGHTVPSWILALGGVGIVIGLATWGWRVIETVGRGITELTPSRGLSAEFGAALTILIASRLGLPISTTHTLVGAILGVGIARGIGALNLTTVRDIVVSWLVTVPAGAVMAIIFFKFFEFIFG